MSPAKLPVEVEEMYGGGCMMALMCRLFRSVMAMATLRSAIAVSAGRAVKEPSRSVTVQVESPYFSKLWHSQ